MNNELTFSFQPWFFDNRIEQLGVQDLLEVDELAKLMLDVDTNFNKLRHIWNTKKHYRIINSPLVGGRDNERHVKLLTKELV